MPAPAIARYDRHGAGVAKLAIRAGFRCPCSKERVGSSPTARTTYISAPPACGTNRSIYTFPTANIYDPEVGVAKRLIEIDDDLLEAARAELKTTGIADTVRTALSFAATRSARIEQIEWLVTGGMADMADPDARERAWR